jgi:hypothetical protein
MLFKAIVFSLLLTYIEAMCNEERIDQNHDRLLHTNSFQKPVSLPVPSPFNLPTSTFNNASPFFHKNSPNQQHQIPISCSDNQRRKSSSDMSYISATSQIETFTRNLRGKHT